MSICTFELKSSVLHYKFDIKSKYTVIRDNSGTGKSTLVDAVNEYYISNKQSGNNTSGINIECNKRCIGLNIRDTGWESTINDAVDSIIFIDEDFISAQESLLASIMKTSHNYFVLVTRYKCCSIPYGLNDIYTMTMVDGVNTLVKMYKGVEQDVAPDYVITEDSSSGYKFFSEYFKEFKVATLTCFGRSNIVRYVKKLRRQGKDGEILIIADGAGISGTIQDIDNMKSKDGRVKVWLPESFEWLLMHSPMFKGKYDSLLENISYESAVRYTNAERLCTDIITQDTKGTPLEYSKNSELDCYICSCGQCKDRCSCEYKVNITKEDKLGAIMVLYPKKLKLKHRDNIITKDIQRAAVADYVRTAIDKKKK